MKKSVAHKIKIAQIGYGYWGKNVARELADMSDVSFDVLYDIDPARQREAKRAFPKAGTAADFKAVLASDVEAVFIVTPPETHYTLAKKAMQAGKHVFVEKPLTTSVKKAYELIALSEKMGVTLFVDHVFIHSEPVRYLKKIIAEGQLGDIVYINSRRVNLGLFQYKVDVIWDLAIHDISIIDYLFGLEIERVSVFKKKYKNFPHDVIANINFDLKSGTTVSLNVSWLSPVKVREMIIGGTKKMVVYDDTAEDKISVYDHGVIIEDSLDTDALHEKLVQYKVGSVKKPKLNDGTALWNSIHNFLESIKNKTEPLTGKQSIINTIQALEMISKI